MKKILTYAKEWLTVTVLLERAIVWAPDAIETLSVIINYIKDRTVAQAHMVIPIQGKERFLGICPKQGESECRASNYYAIVP